jgi:hypothetical protein
MTKQDFVLQAIICEKIGLLVQVWEEKYLKQGPEAPFSFWVSPPGTEVLHRSH